MCSAGAGFVALGVADTGRAGRAVGAHAPAVRAECTFTVDALVQSPSPEQGSPKQGAPVSWSEQLPTNEIFGSTHARPASHSSFALHFAPLEPD